MEAPISDSAWHCTRGWNCRDGTQCLRPQGAHSLGENYTTQSHCFYAPTTVGSRSGASATPELNLLKVLSLCKAFVHFSRRLKTRSGQGLSQPLLASEAPLLGAQETSAQSHLDLSVASFSPSSHSTNPNMSTWSSRFPQHMFTLIVVCCS